MKENDGKAARRVIYQRLGVGAILVGVLALAALSTGSNKNDTNTLRGERRTRRRRAAGLGGRQGGGHGGWPGYDKAGGGSASKMDEETYMQSILRGEVTLVSINPNTLKINPDGSYTGIRGRFCPISWKEHKQNPASTPMFRDVLAVSPACDVPEIDLAKVISRVREYDADPSKDAAVHQLKIGGFVFHESRCGSTLVANLMQAANPAGHRVFSESPPPITIFKEGERFRPEDMTTVVQDVISLMSRSNDPAETHVFFKIQSIGTRNLKVFTAAFPDIPWIFVYRDSVEVLMSYFKDVGDRPSQIVGCNRQARNPPFQVIQKFRELGTTPKSASAETYCAVHFATLTESALEALETPQSRGRAVEYPKLPDIMWESILPDMFHISLQQADIARMKETAGDYSKGRGGKGGAFTEDAARKQEAATDEIKEAAESYLLDSYTRLHSFSHNDHGWQPH